MQKALASLNHPSFPWLVMLAIFVFLGGCSAAGASASALRAPPDLANVLVSAEALIEARLRCVKDSECDDSDFVASCLGQHSSHY